MFINLFLHQLFNFIGKFIIFDKNKNKYSNESRNEIIKFLKKNRRNYK